MGKDKPDSGEIIVGSTVNMIGVGQDRMEELNPSNTVFEEITENMDELELGTQIVASRAYVSWFGFKSAQQQAKVANLSGGERNRVQLAKLLKSGANVLVVRTCVVILLRIVFCLYYTLILLSALHCSAKSNYATMYWGKLYQQ